jgi:hypothetical protein
MGCVKAIKVFERRGVYVEKLVYGGSPTRYSMCYECPEPHGWQEHSDHGTQYGAIMAAKRFIQEGKGVML